MSRTVLLEPLGSMQDSSSLSKYDNVVIMFPGRGASVAPSVKDTNDFDCSIRAWLRNNRYDPLHDCFVVAGRLTKVAVALSTIRDEFHGRDVKILMFDGGTQSYVERKL
jgi:hypothetical protein